jgi:hypothetical protein
VAEADGRVFRNAIYEQRQFATLAVQAMVSRSLPAEPLTVVDLPHDWLKTMPPLQCSSKSADAYQFFLNRDDPLIRTRDPLVAACMEAIQQMDSRSRNGAGLPHQTRACVGGCEVEQPSGCSFYITKGPVYPAGVDFQATAARFCGSGTCARQAQETLRGLVHEYPSRGDPCAAARMGRPTAPCSNCGGLCAQQCSRCKAEF